MPARLIEDEDGVHLRREVPRQVLQEHPHCARIRPRQRQREGLVRARPAGGEQVQARVALIDHAGRAHPALVPDARGPPFLADARLVLAPELELRVRMLRGDGLQPRGELLF